MVILNNGILLFQCKYLRFAQRAKNIKNPESLHPVNRERLAQNIDVKGGENSTVHVIGLGLVRHMGNHSKRVQSRITISDQYNNG